MPWEKHCRIKVHHAEWQARFVMIRGADRNNPVLLHLHGGPGISETGGLRNYNKDLEQDFTLIAHQKLYALQ